MIEINTTNGFRVRDACAIAPVTNPGPCRYVRYLGSTGSYGNITELEFDGL